MAAGEVLTWIALFAITLLVLYFLYGAIYRAFRRVGFTNGEVALILLGTFVGGFFNFPLWAFENGWVLGVNVGGALVPIFVTFVLLRRIPELWREALPGVTIVAIVAYLTTSATPEGIVSPFPLWLLPAAAAAVVSVTAFWHDEGHSAPLAYIAGTLGGLVGADFLRLPEVLALAPPESGVVAAIGGAAVFDMIFLTGILAVTMDTLLFHFRRKEASDMAIPFPEPTRFTTGTPSEVISRYSPTADLTVADRRPPANRR